MSKLILVTILLGSSMGWGELAKAGEARKVNPALVSVPDLVSTDEASELDGNLAIKNKYDMYGVGQDGTNLVCGSSDKSGDDKGLNINICKRREKDSGAASLSALFKDESKKEEQFSIYRGDSDPRWNFAFPSGAKQDMNLLINDPEHKRSFEVMLFPRKQLPSVDAVNEEGKIPVTLPTGETLELDKETLQPTGGKPFKIGRSLQYTGGGVMVKVTGHQYENVDGTHNNGPLERPIKTRSGFSVEISDGSGHKCYTTVSRLWQYSKSEKTYTNFNFETDKGFADWLTKKSGCKSGKALATKVCSSGACGS